MQNQYFDPAYRSGLDSIINSDFDEEFYRSGHLKTKSILGYLNPTFNEDMSSYPAAQISEIQRGVASAETPNRFTNIPNFNPESQPNSASALHLAHDDGFAQPSAQQYKTRPSLMIEVPTASNRFSNYTVGSGLRAGAGSEGYRYSTGMEDQPLRSQNVEKTGPSKRRKIFLILCLLVVICICGVIGLVLGLIHHNNPNINPAMAGAEKIATGEKLWGAGGDTITTEKGTKFVYNNTLGGTWVGIPYNDTARPQGDQPALDEHWDYSANRIVGVNLGGWLVLEPFITPGLFDPYVQAQDPPKDEWDLSKTLGTNLAKTIETHYDSFIVEEDFAQIASAGLNWVRIPVGWWMIETLGDEPFLAGVSWKYFCRAIMWARKYGLRINLDLHAVPGSQNGWNHSGRLGSVGFLAGAMGIANAQRTLNYIRTLTQFISQPEFKRVVPMFSILNEPITTTMTNKALTSWYYESYKLIRQIGGTGEGNGPFVVIHDAFQGVGAGGSSRNSWTGFLQGSDRIGLDSHTYFAFGGQLSDLDTLRPCNTWAARSNQTMDGFGLSMSGEWSLAINDCGLYVNNVGMGSRYEGTFPTASKPEAEFRRVGSCDTWIDHRKWTDTQKKAFADTAQASQDALINSFFWTWKIGSSSRQDYPPNPMWNYKLGLEAGYIRPDARASSGRCAQLATDAKQSLTTYNWSGRLATWQTGGAGAGNISQTQIDAVGPFPPLTIGGGAPNGQGSYNTSSLPQLSPTGPIVPLKATPIVADSRTYSGGDGWFNKQDTAGFYTEVNGCQYLEPWNGVSQPAPPACSLSSGSSKSNPKRRNVPTSLR